MKMLRTYITYSDPYKYLVDPDGKFLLWDDTAIPKSPITCATTLPSYSVNYYIRSTRTIGYVFDTISIDVPDINVQYDLFTSATDSWTLINYRALEIYQNLVLATIPLGRLYGNNGWSALFERLVTLKSHNAQLKVYKEGEELKFYWCHYYEIWDNIYSEGLLRDDGEPPQWYDNVYASIDPTPPVYSNSLLKIFRPCNDVSVTGTFYSSPLTFNIT